MKVLSVFGTRPEAIKMAPVVKALRDHPECFDSLVCVTAQHRHMLDQVLSLFKIFPDVDLNLMKPKQDLTDITANVLVGMRDVLRDLRPDLVLVHGDTTTALAAGLASYYEKIPVGHVEAGLRTKNIYSPWPEEINRRLIAGIACLHFAPTDQARENLLQEGVSPSKIHVTGNSVVDALSKVTGLIKSDPAVQKSLAEKFSFLDPQAKLILVTGHRRENFGDGLKDICRALVDLASCDGVQIIYPVHLNPQVRDPVVRLLGGCANIHLIEPQEYLAFVYLMIRSDLILTDSGGIQEEAPSLGKPVLVLRHTTERPEVVASGAVRLIGTDPSAIFRHATHMLFHSGLDRSENVAYNPYGDGKASERIVAVLMKGLSDHRAEGQ
ncbi:non-hydrolyzing UDP-N-acetylglucosamine 2-epimerase [Desulfuromonas versatilis]|uniref:non-hydrolyzing UDP-N-acetylglucosamine 2-epimerase n=1 Tax=Desulfuromonas versatilis TaxID=2802975 RepID=UPI00384F828F